MTEHLPSNPVVQRLREYCIWAELHEDRGYHACNEALREIERLTALYEREHRMVSTLIQERSTLRAVKQDLTAEIERLRAVLQMAEDCLPDGDYQIRSTVAKEIRDALRDADETTTVKERCASINPDMGMGRCEKEAGHGGFHQAAYVQWFDVR